MKVLLPRLFIITRISETDIVSITKRVQANLILAVCRSSSETYCNQVMYERFFMILSLIAKTQTVCFRWPKSLDNNFYLS